jgi:hypothetical protein
MPTGRGVLARNGLGFLRCHLGKPPKSNNGIKQARTVVVTLLVTVPLQRRGSKLKITMEQETAVKYEKYKKTQESDDGYRKQRATCQVTQKREVSDVCNK